MRIRRALVGGVLVVLCAGACGGNPNGPDSPLGQAFELRAGATASVAGGLLLTFNRVTSESRCAIDAICVWEGDAVLAIGLSGSGAGQATAEIHTQPEQSEVAHGSHRVKLTALSPYPRSDRPTKPEDYIATFTVTAR